MTRAASTATARWSAWSVLSGEQGRAPVLWGARSPRRIARARPGRAVDVEAVKDVGGLRQPPRSLCRTDGPSDSTRASSLHATRSAPSRRRRRSSAWPGLVGQIGADERAGIRVQKAQRWLRSASSASLTAVPEPRVEAITASRDGGRRFGCGGVTKSPAARSRARKASRSSFLVTAASSTSVTRALTERPSEAARARRRSWSASSIRVMSCLMSHDITSSSSAIIAIRTTVSRLAGRTIPLTWATRRSSSSAAVRSSSSR